SAYQRNALTVRRVRRAISPIEIRSPFSSTRSTLAPPVAGGSSPPAVHDGLPDEWRPRGTLCVTDATRCGSTRVEHHEGRGRSHERLAPGRGHVRRIVDLVADVHAGRTEVPDPQLDDDPVTQVAEGRQVLDLVLGHDRRRL